jgi:hypothetical protein
VCHIPNTATEQRIWPLSDQTVDTFIHPYTK